jgi:alkanesulfonate monooxygenase SsuD/methylene tetrahydromethanopterin reductase-like flavin-dependent oxidoreductase (luciferase family)
MKGLKGYESYVKQAEAAKAAGVTQDQAASAFVDNHIYGTPDQCVEKVKAVQQKLGAAGFLAVFNYAGMGEQEALRNQSLFAEKVLPRLKAYEPDLDIAERTLVAAE